MLLRRTGRRARWRYFSLTQVNAEQDGRPQGWTIWTAPESDAAPGRAAFRAAEASRLQGGFEAMHESLLRARHEEDQDLDDPAVLRVCAERSGLDLARFESDLGNPGLIDALRRDHEDATHRLHVFGTPTLVGPSGGTAYVRLTEVPEGADAERCITMIEQLVDDMPYVAEVKRPA